MSARRVNSTRLLRDGRVQVWIKSTELLKGERRGHWRTVATLKPDQSGRFVAQHLPPPAPARGTKRRPNPRR